MLKQIPPCLKQRLLDIYNSMLSTGNYPHTWRSSIVIPIPKPKTNSSEINGYRPISLIPSLSKIIEIMISLRLMWFINRHSLTNGNQVAFKKNHSTMDSILKIQHFVSNAISTRNLVSILDTDFEKAFDRVGPHAVLSRLLLWAIGPRLYNLVKASMTNRTFKVRVNDKTSSSANLLNGIPQGSPLSVVLFIIAFDHVNLSLARYKKINLSLYADDIIIYTKEKNLRTVKNTFLKCVLSSFYRSEVSQKLLLCDPDPFCFRKMRTIVRKWLRSYFYAIHVYFVFVKCVLSCFYRTPFGIRLVIVKIPLSKLLINKNGHIYQLRASYTAWALTFYVRIQTLFYGPENSRWF